MKNRILKIIMIFGGIILLSLVCFTAHEKITKKGNSVKTKDNLYFGFVSEFVGTYTYEGEYVEKYKNASGEELSKYENLSSNATAYEKLILKKDGTASASAGNLKAGSYGAEGKWYISNSEIIIVNDKCDATIIGDKIEYPNCKQIWSYSYKVNDNNIVVTSSNNTIDIVNLKKDNSFKTNYDITLINEFTGIYTYKGEYVEKYKNASGEELSKYENLPSNATAYEKLILNEDGTASANAGNLRAGGYSAEGKWYISNNEIIIINDECKATIIGDKVEYPNCSQVWSYLFEINNNDIVISSKNNTMDKVILNKTNNIETNFDYSLINNLIGTYTYEGEYVEKYKNASGEELSKYENLPSNATVYEKLILNEDGTASANVGNLRAGSYSAEGKWYISNNEIIIVNDKCEATIIDNKIEYPNCKQIWSYSYKINDNNIVVTSSNNTTDMVNLKKDNSVETNFDYSLINNLIGTYTYEGEYVEKEKNACGETKYEEDPWASGKMASEKLVLNEDGTASASAGNVRAGGYSAEGKWYISNNELIIINNKCEATIIGDKVEYPNCQPIWSYPYEITDNNIVITSGNNTMDKVILNKVND